jgi:hypothetical protein
MDVSDSKTSPPNAEATILIPPLADPAFLTIFDSVKRGGLAMKSFLNATFADSDDPLIAEILALTPETDFLGPDRFYCVDVDAINAAGESVFVAVHFETRFIPIELRDKYAFLALSANFHRGSKRVRPIKRALNKISLSFLDFDLSLENEVFHRVAQLRFRDADSDIATAENVDFYPYMAAHYLQFPSFIKIEPDFSNPLHLWLTALIQAQELKRPLKKIVESHPELKDFYQTDPGFAQFVDRYGEATADPKLQEKFQLWTTERRKAKKRKG